MPRSSAVLLSSILIRIPTTIPAWLPIALFMAALLGVPVGIYCFYRGFSLLSRKRLIQNIPRSSIRSAPIGQIEISGTAIGPYTILSPLSQTDCYYYQAEAHLLREKGDQTSSPQRVIESLSVPFFIEDETGRMMVDARGADVELPCTYDQVVGRETAGDCVRHFLERRGLPSSGVRVVERCIVDGDRLFVLGTIVENSVTAGANSASREPGFLSREAADLQRREILEFMHVSIPQKLRSYSNAAAVESTFNVNPPIVVSKAASRQPFIISRRSQRQLVDVLAAESILYIWGGPLLSAVSLAYILIKLAKW